jgi:dihydroorotate dehydrogenase (NAD+) catalytic subunit
LLGLAKTRLGGLGVRSPFTIPSGVVTTLPPVIARIAKEIPEIGFLTTKTISLAPREGYREPVLYEYHPGCFVNAVGLANPGAEAFRNEMGRYLPLHDGKPLVVSIMGADPEEFLACARALAPIASAFELNFSCPHVKGAGQAMGADPESVRGTLRLLKSEISQPLIPKLSPNLGDVAEMAALCEQAGADALCMINTVGPGMGVDSDGNPVLSNVVGGLSGAGVLPLGLKAVREAATRVSIPIIACGGIGGAGDVRAYRQAGASLFGIGTALAGLTTPEIVEYFKGLALRLDEDAPSEKPRGASPVCRTAYARSFVVENRRVGPGLFWLELEKGPQADPGQFFFLRLPNVGEKPFSPERDNPPAYLVRRVGPFTEALAGLKPGDAVYMRGPYGRGFPPIEPGRPLVALGGGAGSAPVMMAASRRRAHLARAFFGFSGEVADALRREIGDAAPGAHIVVDSEGNPGEVVRVLTEDIRRSPKLYAECTVFMCGPAAMMNAALDVLRQTTPLERVFTAREDIMRCGIGLCGSCGFAAGMRSCVDGPVISGDL